ncbi:MAG: signal peptidase II [Lachnospira sp.]|nr:signal peptidase II [Lachnospira sp.]
MKNRINKKGLTVYFIGVIILCLIDQLTKIAAVNTLKGKNPFVIIDGVFEFYYLENSGAAWGMMSGGRIIFMIITVVIVLAAIYVMALMPNKAEMIKLQTTITFLSAGAIGNFIDRLFLGYVRDFIYFKLIDFPVFNVADIYVTVSEVCLIILILFVYKEDEFAFLKRKK